MSTRALLLGAGFSHNFGLPLAQNVLVEVFNKVKSTHLKNEILARISDGNGNFENYYAEKILSENADDVAEINSEAFSLRTLLHELLGPVTNLWLPGLGFSYRCVG